MRVRFTASHVDTGKIVGTRSARALLLVMASALTLWCPHIHAESSTRVYKTTHADGSVTYSDQASDRAEAMDVKPVDTVPAFQAPSDFNSAPATNTPAPAPLYSAFRIDQPAQNAAFWSGNGNVMVTITVQPALRERHSLQVLLDGKVMMQTRDTQVTLANIDRGTHDLEVQILDKLGEPLQRAQHTFTLHRPSAIR